MTHTPDAEAPEELMWRGRFVEVKRRGRWEYAGRPGGICAAVVLALDESHVILVEQYRVPIGRRCLELPAGLIGDEGGDEDALSTARRELEEETGWRAAHVEAIGDFFSSPGMLSESFTLVRATGLTRVSDGGGVEGENIRVHRVPLSGVAAFLEAKRGLGCAMDVKLLLLLGGAMLAGAEPSSKSD